MADTPWGPLPGRTGETITVTGSSAVNPKPMAVGDIITVDVEGGESSSFCVTSVSRDGLTAMRVDEDGRGRPS